MGAPLGRTRTARPARALLRLLLAACLLAPAAPARAEPTVVLISMDGTRPADLDASELPALSRMAREGARAERLVPVFPANTFPNHVTLVTGVSPERHGIVNNTFVDPERGRFHYAGDPTWLEAEPLWSILAGHGLSSASYYWVGSEGAWRSGRGPAEWRPFSSRTRESEKIDQVLRWLALPEAERPRLVTVWFHGADGAAHRHGPGAPEVEETLRVQDAQLERLLRRLDVEGRWGETTVIVVSDHGMAAIEGSVDLQAALGEAGIEAQVHGGGGFVTVTLDDPGKADEAAAAARGLGLEAWPRGEGPPGLEASNPRFGDLVAMAPPGTVISPAGLLGRLRTALMGGGHGYRPELPVMGGIFLALGRGVDAGVRPGEVRALDVAPTVLSLLGLPVPASMEGEPIALAAAASSEVDAEGGPN
jgi:predicted AlkP superfamily pyrophosphatase or phosphodiesterase